MVVARRRPGQLRLWTSHHAQVQDGGWPAGIDSVGARVVLVVAVVPPAVVQLRVPGHLPSEDKSFARRGGVDELAVHRWVSDDAGEGLPLPRCTWGTRAPPARSPGRR